MIFRLLVISGIFYFSVTACKKPLSVNKRSGNNAAAATADSEDGIDPTVDGVLTSDSTMLSVDYAAGVSLWDTRCASCHGNFEDTAPNQRSAASIQHAIDHVPEMAFLKESFTPDHLRTLSKTLNYPYAKCSEEGTVLPTGLRHLSNREYLYTVEDWLETEVPDSDRLPSEIKHGHLLRTSDLQALNADNLQVYTNVATDVAAIVTEKIAVEGAAYASRIGLTCLPVNKADQDCLREAIVGTLRIAHRRPVENSVRDRYLNAILNELVPDNRNGIINFLITTTLSSPEFLYHFEESSENEETAISIDSHELAARLSYTLWGSLPDATLRNLADNNSLLTDAVFTAEIDRLMADPKFKRVAKLMLESWLRLDENRSFPGAQSDRLTEETWGDALRESELFLEYLLEQDKPIADLFVGTYSFMNNNLRSHYGIAPSANGNEFSLQPLSETPRRGLLSQLRLLVATGDSTSVVSRGKFVADHLLCSEPLPPPPDALDENGEPESIIPEGLSVKQKVEFHRSNAECASCHYIMDAVGISLEGFDVVGMSRQSYPDGKPVETSSVLEDGTTLSGFDAMGAYFSQSEEFSLCVSKRLFHYVNSAFPNRLENCAIKEFSPAKGSQGIKTILRQMLLDQKFKLKLTKEMSE